MRYKVSVLKRFRSESKMQFYATAQKLRKDLHDLQELVASMAKEKEND